MTISEGHGDIKEERADTAEENKIHGQCGFRLLVGHQAARGS